jgi:peptidoglycan/LPS O-acetylase OafA/YrhL
MTHRQNKDKGSIFLPSLEGVRGLGFLPVFFGHYLAPVLMTHGKHGWLFPLWILAGTAWFAVPIFFVLSGFLIGGILFDTREKEGFFRVFYSRRILRVFPLYYLALLAVGAGAILHGLHLNLSFFSHFLYIQNLFPGYEASMPLKPLNQIIPLWSLAVEEQFYILWPLVVWFCKDRQTLLRVTAILIGVSCVLRFAAPLFGLSSMQCYFFTPMRIDAILVGVLLSLLRREPIWNRMIPRAKYAALAGMAVMLSATAMSGWLLPATYRRMALLIPFANLVSVAVILAVMESGSRFNRFCSKPWLCWFGSRVYGMYVIHYLFLDWFTGPAASALSRFVRYPVAYAASMIVAFCLTVLLADLSFRFVERPAMNLKSRIRYGTTAAARPVEVEFQGEPILAQTD